MSTVQLSKLEFNPKLKVVSRGDPVSSFGGAAAVRDFLHHIHFNKLLQDTVRFHDPRKNPIHSIAQMTDFMITQRILGFKTELSANYLRFDPLLQLLWGDPLPSQATLSRYYHYYCEDLPALNGLHQFLRKLAERQLSRMHGRLVFDMDSTVLKTYGHQEGIGFIAHYQAMGYHPLVIYEGRTGLLLDVELRNGRVYTSARSDIYLAQLLDRSPHRSVILRGDSGFATPRIYDLAESQHIKYVIKLKANPLLKQLGKNVWQTFVARYGNDGYTHTFVLWYRASTWCHARRVIMEIQHKLNREDATIQFFVTNLTTAPATIAGFYRKRGKMEKFIQQTKTGYYADRMSSTNFFMNEARMIFSCLAYNLMRLMALQVFPAQVRDSEITGIRTDLLYLGVIITHHARSIWLNLTPGHPGVGLFWQVLKNVHDLPT